MSENIIIKDYQVALSRYCYYKAMEVGTGEYIDSIVPDTKHIPTDYTQYGELSHQEQVDGQLVTYTTDSFIVKIDGDTAYIIVPVWGSADPLQSVKDGKSPTAPQDYIPLANNRAYLYLKAYIAQKNGKIPSNVTKLEFKTRTTYDSTTYLTSIVINTNSFSNSPFINIIKHIIKYNTEDAQVIPAIANDYCSACSLVKTCPLNELTVDDISFKDDNRKYRKKYDAFKQNREIKEVEHISQWDKTEDPMDYARFYEYIVKKGKKAQFGDKKYTMEFNAEQDYIADIREEMQKRRIIVKEKQKETTMQMGAIFITATINKIMMKDQKEVGVSSVLRSNDATVAKRSGSNRSAAIELTFSGEKQINTELRHIIAQARAYPYIHIRNETLSRLYLPIEMYLDYYLSYNKHLTETYLDNTDQTALKNHTTTGSVSEYSAKTKKIYQEAMFVYAIRSISVSVVNAKVDTLRAQINVQLVDVSPLTNDDSSLRYLYDTKSALEQGAWETNNNLANRWNAGLEEDGTNDGLIRHKSLLNTIADVTEQEVVDTNVLKIKNVKQHPLPNQDVIVLKIPINLEFGATNQIIDNNKIGSDKVKLKLGSDSIDVIVIIYKEKGIATILLRSGTLLINLYEIANSNIISTNWDKHKSIKHLFAEVNNYVKGYKKVQGNIGKKQAIKKKISADMKDLLYTNIASNAQQLIKTKKASYENIKQQILDPLNKGIKNYKKQGSVLTVGDYITISYELFRGIVNNLNDIDFSDPAYICNNSTGIKNTKIISKKDNINPLLFQFVKKLGFIRINNIIPVGDTGVEYFTRLIDSMLQNIPAYNANLYPDIKPDLDNLISTAFGSAASEQSILDASPKSNKVNNLGLYHILEHDIVDQAKVADQFKISHGDLFDSVTSNLTRNLQVISSNNKTTPVNRSLTTTNPAMSKVWIKYYTAYLEEYNYLNAITDASVKKSSSKNNDALMEYILSITPDYLYMSPYSTISQVVPMAVYKGQGANDKNIKTEEELAAEKLNNKSNKLKTRKTVGTNQIKLMYPIFTPKLSTEWNETSSAMTLYSLYHSIVSPLENYIMATNTYPADGRKYINWLDSKIKTGLHDTTYYSKILIEKLKDINVWQNNNIVLGQNKEITSINLDAIAHDIDNAHALAVLELAHNILKETKDNFGKINRKETLGAIPDNKLRKVFDNILTNVDNILTELDAEFNIYLGINTTIINTKSNPNYQGVKAKPKDVITELGLTGFGPTDLTTILLAVYLNIINEIIKPSSTILSVDSKTDHRADLKLLKAFESNVLSKLELKKDTPIRAVMDYINTKEANLFNKDEYYSIVAGLGGEFKDADINALYTKYSDTKTTKADKDLVETELVEATATYLEYSNKIYVYTSMAIDSMIKTMKQTKDKVGTNLTNFKAVYDANKLMQYIDGDITDAKDLADAFLYIPNSTHVSVRQPYGIYIVDDFSGYTPLANFSLEDAVLSDNYYNISMVSRDSLESVAGDNLLRPLQDTYRYMINIIIGVHGMQPRLVSTRWNKVNIQNSKETTITNFTIQRQTNMVPIYMSGHQNPLPQNLGQGTTSIQLEFASSNLDLIEALMVASTELNVMMKYMIAANSENPLAVTSFKTQKNSVFYNSKLRGMVERLQQASENDDELDMANRVSESPVYIDNNIASMMGLAAVGITDINITTVDNQPNLYIVNIAMFGVSPIGSTKEVPRKKLSQVDYKYMLQDLATLPAHLWDPSTIETNPIMLYAYNTNMNLASICGALTFIANPLGDDVPKYIASNKTDVKLKYSLSLGFVNVIHFLLTPFFKALLNKQQDKKESTEYEPTLYDRINRKAKDNLSALLENSEEIMNNPPDTIASSGYVDFTISHAGEYKKSLRGELSWDRNFDNTITSIIFKNAYKKKYPTKIKSTDSILNAYPLYQGATSVAHEIYSTAIGLATTEVSASDSYNIKNFPGILNTMNTALKGELHNLILPIISTYMGYLVNDIIYATKLILETPTNIIYKNTADPIIQKKAGIERALNYLTGHHIKKQTPAPQPNILPTQTTNTTTAIWQSQQLKNAITNNNKTKNYITNGEALGVAILEEVTRITQKLLVTNSVHNDKNYDDILTEGEQDVITYIIMALNYIETDYSASREIEKRKETGLGIISTTDYTTRVAFNLTDKANIKGFLGGFREFLGNIGLLATGIADALSEQITRLGGSDYIKLLNSFKVYNTKSKLFQVYRFADAFYGFYVSSVVGYIATDPTFSVEHPPTTEQPLKLPTIEKTKYKIISDYTAWNILVHMANDPGKFADKYNAYPDYNLPILFKISDLNAATIKNKINNKIGKLITNNPKATRQISTVDTAKILSALESIMIFTAPDFFIYKRQIAVSEEQQGMLDNLGAASAMMMNKDLEESHKGATQYYTEKLKELHDMSKDLNVETTIRELEYEGRLNNYIHTANSEFPELKLDEDNIRVPEGRDIYGTAKAANGVQLSEELRKTIGNTEITKQLQKVMKTASTGKKLKNDPASLDLINKSVDLQEEYSRISLMNARMYQLNNLLYRQKHFGLADTTGKMVGAEVGFNQEDVQLIDTLINPSNGAYNMQSANIVQSYLMKSIVSSNRVTPKNTPRLALPTYKIYLIDKNYKEMLMFNDFYEYNAVKDLRVYRSRTSAASTATLVLSNVHGRLSNLIKDRYNLKNPFKIHGDQKENITALMLRVGAMIQIRMGYNSNLGPEAVVFSGEITEIMGDDELQIVAQGWGSQMTRIIGTGEGKDFTGIFSLLMNPTSRTKVLIGELMDMADGFDHLGTKSPFLGAVAANRISATETTNTVGSYIKTNKVINVLSKFTGSAIDLVDTRLMNVNTAASNGGEVKFGHKWLVYNDTLWNSLFDLTLTLSGKKMMVRPIDEEATFVLGDESDFYQYTLENYVQTNSFYKILLELRNSTDNSVSAIALIARLIKKEIQGSVGADTVIINLDNYINILPITRLFYSTFKNVIAHFDDETRKSILDKMNIDVILKYILRGLDANNLMNDVYSELYKQTLSGMFKDSAVLKKNKIEFKNKNLPIGFMAYALGKAFSTTSKILYEKIVTSIPGFRKITNVHYKTSEKDIVHNDITLEASFNRVELSYLRDDLGGYIASLVGLSSIGTMLLGFKSISLGNLNRPASRAVLSIAFSKTLRFSALRTYGTFQKNAAARETLTRDTLYTTANKILANLIKDYYGGTITFLLDPTIMPHDVIYIYDSFRDMWGIVGVKDVTHSISRETGAVTVITPDVYVQERVNNLDKALTTGQAIMRGVSLSLSAIITILTIWIGSAALKRLGGILARSIPKLGKVLGRGGTKAITKAMGGSIKDIKIAVKQLTKKLSEAEKKEVATGMSNAMKSLSNAINSTRTDNNALRAVALEFLDTSVTDGAGEAELEAMGKGVLDVMERNVENFNNLIEITDGGVVGFKASLDSVKFNKALTEGDEAIVKSIYNAMGRRTKVTEKEIAEMLNNDAGKMLYDTMIGESELHLDTSMLDKFVYFTDGLTRVGNKNMLSTISGITKFVKFSESTGRFAPFKNAVKGLLKLTAKASINVLKWGILYRVGNYVMDLKPLHDMALTMGGEHILGTEPLIIAGLVHRGEPYMSNLEGIKKDRLVTTKASSFWNKMMESLFGNYIQATDEITAETLALKNTGSISPQ